jgi:GTP-binding protein
MFADKVKIFAKAGDGGNGCVSFRREKFIDRGGPDGGNGGDGGSIVLVADANANTLSDLFYAPHLLAKNGEHGRGKNCYGRNAKEVIARVPPGTQVYLLGEVRREQRTSRYHPAAATEEFDPDVNVGMYFGDRRKSFRPKEPALPAGTPGGRTLVADLVEVGQRVVLARGGNGGRGNTTYKSSTHQAPREFEYGEPGEQLEAELELKTIADVGLVGYPNAGKSTLISKITHAQPKIASYPFTTLTPNVGILTFEDYGRVRVADIPGLIDGAHTGKGLGHDFLRHIERCGLLLVLLDMAGVDGRKPLDDYKQLLEELKLHNPALLDKPYLVVANKMDLPAAKKNLVAFKRKHRGRVHSISALESDGLDKLKLAIRKAVT